jgi:hypothetical protein
MPTFRDGFDLRFSLMSLISLWLNSSLFSDFSQLLAIQRGKAPFVLLIIQR